MHLAAVAYFRDDACATACLPARPMRTGTALWFTAWRRCSLLAGCMRARVDESRELAYGHRRHRISRRAGQAADRRRGCGVANSSTASGNRISGRNRSIAVHSNEAFTDKLFPWFEPGTVPTRAEGSGRGAGAAWCQRAGGGHRRALRGVARRRHAQAPTVVAASPAALRPVRPAASASAGGKRNRPTRPPSGTCKQSRSVGSVGTNVTRHLGNRRRHRAAAIHRARAGHRLQPHGRAAAQLPGRHAAGGG